MEVLFSANKQSFVGMVILIAICLLPIYITAQSHRIDSLKNAIQHTTTTAQKLNSTLELCKEKNSLSGDSLFVYASMARQLAQQLNDNSSEAWAEYYLKAHLLANGKIDSVLTELETNSKATLVLKDRNLYYKLQLLKANALNRKNKLNESLAFQLQILSEAEKDDNVSARLFVLNYLGSTYMNMGNFDESKTWYFKGLALIDKKATASNFEIQAYIYYNLGLLYINAYNSGVSKSISDSSLLYLDKAIVMSGKYEYLGILASALITKGNFLSTEKKFEEAEKAFTKGIAIRDKIGDPYYKMNDLINLGSFYFQSKQYQKSIAANNEGLQLAKTNNIKADQLQLLQLKAIDYKMLNDYKMYSSILEEYILAADSGIKVNSSLQLAEIQTKYEVQKKETQIAEQNLSLLQRKYLLYGSLVIFVISLFAGYISFKNYRGKQKLKLQLILQQEQKQKELAIRNAEEKERIRIAADLHDNIGVQASAILYGTELLKYEPQTGNNVVNNLHDTAKEMLVNLRETLWAMKNTDIAAADLWLRVINFCKQMGRHYSHINIHTVGTPPKEFVLASAQALNLMMIVQETVNNAAKHSGADDIIITNKMIDNTWQLKIEDNGKGFDLAAARQQKDSNGLGNMQERANASGTEIFFETAAGKGTGILLSVKAV